MKRILSLNNEGHIGYKFEYLLATLVMGMIFLALLVGCKKDPQISDEAKQSYSPTPLAIEKPFRFPDLVIPDDNPMTVEGVELGQMLFFDPILSLDNTISCSSCHRPENYFSDDMAISPGVNGGMTNRNAMPLINLMWAPSLNWDGSAESLEEQAITPVQHPQEMNLNWNEAINRLKNHSVYPDMFRKAFGDIEISQSYTIKAIAQYERTLISSNSKFDRFLRGEVELTDDEIDGYLIFNTEKGDCFHCHGVPEASLLLTDNDFHNNGLDSMFSDLGLGAITNDANDNGKFKTPTLRNIEFTAPYMHDGRFETLEEVIDFYSEEVKNSSTIDPLMKKLNQGGIGLTMEEKEDLIAFLKTFTDTSFAD